MATCLIALGSNLADRKEQLNAACVGLKESPTIQGLRVSSFVDTQPIGGPADQPRFLNAAAVFETSSSPQQLWQLLQSLEARAGRAKSTRWGPRRLDLDLLLYGDREFQTDRLMIPHPRMSFRRFALEPAAEIAAQMVHPTTDQTIEQLRDRLDRLPNYLAVEGIPAALVEASVSQASSRVDQNFVLSASSAADISQWSPADSRQLQARLVAQVAQTQANGLVLLTDFFTPIASAAGEIAPSPKVLVLLDDQKAANENLDRRQQIWLSGQLSDEMELFAAESKSEFLARQVLAAKRLQVPVLHVSGTEPAWIVQEITAAAEAMR